VISWDIPLLEGYDWEFAPNRAADPGTHHFRGLDNPEMPARLAAWRPDALLVYGWANRTHLNVLRRFKGRVPILFRGDSTLMTGARGLRRLARMPVLRWVYSHVDLALYPGQRNREYLRACGVGETRMAWMPHCVDNSRFSANAASLERQAAAARRELGVAEDEIAFVFAGKLVPWKAVDHLIRAFLDAPWRAARPHLIIAGSGPREDELRQLAGGHDRVHFLGFRNQTEMPLTYRLGDAFVLPSTGETWGLAVNEAMASARPVVVSDRVGCSPDLAADAGFARAFPAGDVASLGRTLAGLAGDRRELHHMGAKALSFIQGWSVEAAVDRLCEAVARVRPGLGRPVSDRGGRND
jgi:glycosyltransferase involved in cell wall biosynthesis